MKLKIARRIVFATWGIIILLAFIASLTESVISQVSAILALVVVAISIVISIRFVRCPYCDSLLRVYHFKYKHCPHCGEKLDW